MNRFRVASLGACLGLAIIAPLAPAAEADGTMLKADTLMKEPLLDGDPVQQMSIGEKVTIVGSRPGWYAVKSDGETGWVRMFSVARGGITHGPAASLPAVVESDRAAIGVRALPRSNAHALVIGISQFANPAIPPLPGIRFDIQSATRMALASGVPAPNISVVRDADATLEGMVQLLQALAARLQPNDHVFIYFSGHGTRFREPTARGAQCTTALVAHDGRPFSDYMIAEALTALAAKAEKLFVFIDACYSGGVVASKRSVGGGLTPKFFGGAADECATPTNVVARGIEGRDVQPWAGRNNFVYVTAARETEITFDDARSGGFATSAFRECFDGKAQDLDGSGSVSVDELRSCAQSRMDEWFKGSKDLLPSHITIVGNRDYVPGLPQIPGTEPLVPSPPAVQSGLGAAPALQPPVASPISAQTRLDPAKTLLDVHAQRDDRRQVTLRLSKSKFKIGKDRLDFVVSSSHAGYLYILYAGLDGKSFDMLFPNQLDRENFIAARKELRLPRGRWQLAVQGPPGRDRLLALVADSPRDFSRIGMKPSGPFSSVAVSPSSVRSIIVVSATSANAEDPDCTAMDRMTRSLQVVEKCSNAYGSAVADVIETE